MEQIRQTLRESNTARWIALALISLTMFFAYFFVDVAAPLQRMLETDYKWTPEVFGMLGGSEFVLNVFAFFLILSGIILDKMGIRFTLITSGLAMVLGASIKYYALTEGFANSDLAVWLNTFIVWIPASAKLAFFGFAIFGVGVEMAGITVSKTIVKWFKGKEMALAMGLEMAVARLGVFAVFRLSPVFAENGGVSSSVLWGVAFLLIGFLTFFTYTFMDSKLDKQMGVDGSSEPEEEFKLSDLGKIFTNPGFLSIAGLCVLFYSAIFPFQKFATDMLASKLDVPIKDAAAYFSYFPIGAMILTPFIGFFLDVRGKGASMMMYGAILLTISHLIFALVPADVFNVWIAIITIVVLGTAFSLVPASMWPSLPKIVEDRYLGSAYGSIFWIQNIGLLAVPILIGWALSASNPGVGERITAISNISEKLEKNHIELKRSYDEFIKESQVYHSEFETGVFSDQHKNYLFVRHYADDNIQTLGYAVEQLTQQFAYASNRVKVLDSLEITLKRMEVLGNDSLLMSNFVTSNQQLLADIKGNVIEMQKIKEDAKYNYTIPELIFAGFGVLAFLLSFVLKYFDRKKGYGLDMPNKKH